MNMALFLIVRLITRFLQQNAITHREIACYPPNILLELKSNKKPQLKERYQR